MADLWATRDLPVLQVLAEHFDDPSASREPDDLAARAGVDDEQVRRALWWLTDAGYINGKRAMGNVIIRVLGVTERGRREAGLWPTPEGLADRLEAAFRAAAAAEPDPERRTKLQAVLGAFSGIGRAVTTDVLTQIVERQIGLS